MLFLGVFYHLRSPISVLERIRGVTAGTLICETHALVPAFHENYPLVSFFPGDGLEAGLPVRILLGADDRIAEADAARGGLLESRRQAHAVDALAEEDQGGHHDASRVGPCRRPRVVSDAALSRLPMRALVLDQNGLADRSDYPDPLPRDGEVLVRVLRAGVCETDLQLIRGYMGFSGVLGHEFVGVAESGPMKGRRVVGEINCSCWTCPTCRAGAPSHCPNRSVLGILNHDGAFADLHRRAAAQPARRAGRHARTTSPSSRSRWPRRSRFRRR